METVHGTCVAIDGWAGLLRGPPGSGKSDLALRVIESGGRLVADDRTILTRRDDGLIASCPDSISGLLEIRGIGIARVPALPSAPLVVVYQLVPPERVPRLPAVCTCRYLGVSLPLLALAPFEVSAAAKVRYGVSMSVRRNHS